VLDPTLPDLRQVIGAEGLALLQSNQLLEPLLERLLITALISDVELDPAMLAAARQAYAQQHQLSVEVVPNEAVERPLRMARLAREQFAAKAESRFLSEKGRLDRVVYSLLRLESRSQAQELYLRIAHGEAEFSELASRYSQGPERNTQGMIGPSPLNQAHPALSEKLRAAKPGSLLEPFPIERWWVVARLERFAPASFDERMADQMSMELLQEWVKQETTHKLGELINDASGTDRS
jgi:parvulin-like peptidyl-prolyl isomerase